MAKYCVVDSVNLGSTHYAERIFDAVNTEKDIENGTFGYLDGLAEGESVIYKFHPGYKAGESVVIVDNPAWDYDTCRISNQRRDKYINKTGKPFRVRVLKKNDEFGITIEGVKSDSQSHMKKGAFVTIDNESGKLVAKEGSLYNQEEGLVGEVMRERMIGGALTTVAHNYGYTSKMFEVKVKDVAAVKAAE